MSNSFQFLPCYIYWLLVSVFILFESEIHKLSFRHANITTPTLQQHVVRTVTIPFITDLLREMKPLFHEFRKEQYIGYSVRNETELRFDEESNDNRSYSVGISYC